MPDTIEEAEVNAEAEGKIAETEEVTVRVQDDNESIQNGGGATTKTTESKVDTSRPCDMCVKLNVACRIEGRRLNCAVCEGKKQACRWDGLNRRGEVVVWRVKKVERSKKGKGKSSTGETGVKRKRSKVIVVSDSDNEEEAGPSSRSPKSKSNQISFFLQLLTTSNNFLQLFTTS